MAVPQLKEDRKYTYEDYLTWPDDERWELIDGVPYMMSPAPSDAHQDIVGVLFNELFNCLEKTPCKPRLSPQDVRFAEKDEEDTVVQPDITVWCKKDGAEERELNVVVEVLSPSSATRDLVTKLDLYERQGIPEYWVVSPDDRCFVRYALSGGKYMRTLFSTGEFSSCVLAGFAVDVQGVFARAEE